MVDVAYTFPLRFFCDLYRLMEKWTQYASVASMAVCLIMFAAERMLADAPHSMDFRSFTMMNMYVIKNGSKYERILLRM